MRRWHGGMEAMRLRPGERSAWLLAGAAMMIVSIPAVAQTRQFDVPAQQASRAIPLAARQAGIQILARADVVRGKRTRQVRGTFDVTQALRLLLEGTGLAINGDARAGGIITIVSIKAATGIAQSGEAAAGSAPAEEVSADDLRGTPDILVVGSRSQNTDVARTRDDPQPYVVITADEIAKSNVTTIDQLLRTRLPQNAQSGTTTQRNGSGLFGGNRGQIDLRGLGTNQTLVLVDGRRLPGVSEAGDLQQSNIAGIPVSSIERIEVLSSSAGAIYGGSAVGGVVNIILKRDYKGLNIDAIYGNTFDGATGDILISANGGFRAGPASVLLRAGVTRTATLPGSDREFLFRRSQELVDANNPNPNLRLGETTNFIANAFLVLKNGTPLNSNFGSVPLGYAGPASDGGAALVANAGRYSGGVAPGPSALIQRTQTENAGGNVRVPITPGIDAYVDVNWDRTHSNNRNTAAISGLLPYSDPNNPFQQNVFVVYSTPAIYSRGINYISNIRVAGGLIVRLPGKWSASLEQTWNRTRSGGSNNQNAVAGDVDRTPLLQAAFRDTTLLPPDFPLNTRPGSVFGPSQSWLVDSIIRVSGPTFDLAGGPLVLTGLAERRQNRFGETINRNENGSAFDNATVIAKQRQTVQSLYAEARAPIVSDRNGGPFLRQLELQGSIRYDHYATYGTSSQFTAPTPEAAREAAAAAVYNTNRIHSTDFLGALLYAPVRDLTLRGSYSTGFLAPSNSQVSSFLSTQPAFFVGFFNSDPKRFDSVLGFGEFPGDADGNIAFINGGNPALQPEKSRSLSLGAIFKPHFVPGLRLSADWTHIRKSNEIIALSDQEILTNEDLLPGRIVRGPNLPGDPANFAGPVISIDRTFLNAFKSRVTALDLQADYDFAIKGAGAFHVYAIATHQIKLARQINTSLDLVETVDFANGPLRWRGNAGLDFTSGGLRLNYNVQYYSSYNGYIAIDDPSFRDAFIQNQGAERIPAQAYHDIAASYRFPDESYLSGLEIGAGIQNLLDKVPPVINANNGVYSNYGDPRLRRFTLSVKTRL